MKWEDLQRNFDRLLDHSDIDQFANLVKESTSKQLAGLAAQGQALTPAQFEDPMDLDRYRDHLSEQMVAVEAVRQLADELRILALMKKVELQLNGVLRAKVPAYFGPKKITFLGYRTALGEGAYLRLGNRAAFRELHLLCNSIKHDGLVTEELATECPPWAEGADLTGLDVAYERLCAQMVEFVHEYVMAIYAKP